MSLQKILFAVFAIFSSTSAIASVRIAEALGRVRGDYRLVMDSADLMDCDTHKEIEFTILEEDKVNLTKWCGNNGGVETKLSVASLENKSGPNSLPVITLILNQGSDEQSYSYYIRLTFQKNGSSTKVALLDDVIQTSNDGPNGIADASHVTTATLYKRNKTTKEYVALNKLK